MHELESAKNMPRHLEEGEKRAAEDAGGYTLHHTLSIGHS